MKPSLLPDEPCLWLPGHPSLQVLNACRPPRLRVRNGAQSRRRQATPVPPRHSDVPPIAPAPGGRVGDARERGSGEVQAFAAVALCGW
ncbi:hypothetical protein AB0F43_05350 [Kribbella sp. NPDC023972]|uniref:hypothetical protein n=1 Tax=Kribbella sp. NPDC023972 TaxID=3154795 RepID=UPI0034006326